ncbi:MAG: sensor histidine kinase, partial [Coriobacteriia bacterium]
AGPLNEEQCRQLEMVRTAGRHLLALIDDVLDLSKIEAGVSVQESERFNIVEMLLEAIESVRPCAEARGLSLEFSAPRDSAWIESDRRRVMQIVLNLLSNAVKFTDEGGVTVTLECDTTETVISVEDTGVGISPGDVERVFEEFYQVGENVSSPGGTGLGLAVSQRLAERLGGHIDARSVRDQGSTFRLVFPQACGRQLG